MNNHDSASVSLITVLIDLVSNELQVVGHGFKVADVKVRVFEEMIIQVDCRGIGNSDILLHPGVPPGWIGQYITDGDVKGVGKGVSQRKCVWTHC